MAEKSESRFVTQAEIRRAEIRAAMIAAGDTLVAGGTEDQALEHARAAGRCVAKAFVEGEKPVAFKKSVRRGSTT